jgi:hypothetical protein
MEESSLDIIDYLDKNIPSIEPTAYNSLGLWLEENSIYCARPSDKD